MSPAEKTLLTTAFEALGPERVTRGLQTRGHTWNDCFLALATYGEAGVLGRETEKRWRRDRYVGALLGVRVQVVNEVVRTWDQEEEAFRALAAEWLELNRAAAATGAAVGS